MLKNNEVIQKENFVQAILIADTFDDEFVPFSETIPPIFLPILNKPIIDYTLEFLSLGGIEETFLFCSSNADSVKEHINKCLKNGDGWTLTMRVNVVVSESCHSFGDCLRDIDAKGLLRGDFILLEPGIISNIPLLQLLKKHSSTTKTDKGAAMTVILQESSIGHIGRCPEEEYLLAVNSDNRVIFHKKLGKHKEKIVLPLDMLLENSSFTLHHNVRDTHLAICSPSVLPLFSDNFDFQTKDDFVRGLLMNEEILGSTVYCHILKGNEFGAAVSNWRMYKVLSQELKNNWIYPLTLNKRNKRMKNDVIMGEGAKIDDSVFLSNSVLGNDITVGKNSKIEESVVFSGCKIEDNVIISKSIIGYNSIVKSRSKVLEGSIIGQGTVIDSGLLVENLLVQSEKPFDYEEGDKLGNKAYKLRILDENEDNSSRTLPTRLSQLCFSEVHNASDVDSSEFSDSDDDDRLSHTQTPPADDTKLFYTEVIDSLTRGFDEKLSCDNLILEINSSRYAYNVTVKEVNFNVVKAILNMSLRETIGVSHSHLSGLLSFFAPILKNYIRNESAMTDCLQAVEDVSSSNEELNEKWVMFLLNYLYDKDFVSEETILDWYDTLDQNSKFHSRVKPFVNWLREAEEASSSDSD